MLTGHPLGRGRPGLSETVCPSTKGPDWGMPCLQSSCWSWRCPSVFFPQKENKHSKRFANTQGHESEREGQPYRRGRGVRGQVCPLRPDGCGPPERSPELPLPTVGGSQGQGTTLSVGKASSTPPPRPPVFAQGLALQKLKPAARAARRRTPAGAAQALPSMGRPAAGGASRRR